MYTLTKRVTLCSWCRVACGNLREHPIPASSTEIPQAIDPTYLCAICDVAFRLESSTARLESGKAASARKRVAETAITGGIPAVSARSTFTHPRLPALDTDA